MNFRMRHLFYLITCTFFLGCLTLPPPCVWRYLIDRSICYGIYFLYIIKKNSEGKNVIKKKELELLKENSTLNMNIG